MSTRRNLLIGAASIVAGGSVLTVASVHAAEHPDAELIRLCAEHVVNMCAYNQNGGLKDVDEPDPLRDAYEHTRDAISDAKPRTLAGMQAKARAAKAEALPSRGDGRESSEGTPAEAWAWTWSMTCWPGG